jgi:hypothetical protein
MQWKQRLYAFLLRRVLGPILTSSSKAQLVHESVDVQVTEGKFLLKDVELDVDYLHSKISCLAVEGLSKIRLQRVSIQKLEIQLSLVDESEEACDTNQTGQTLHSEDLNSYSSLSKALGTATAVMRKIYKLRTVDQHSQYTHNISLVAQVVLDGVDINIMEIYRNSSDDDNSEWKSMEKRKEMVDLNKSQASNFISSYIEAAMNSLKLNVTISHIKIHMSSYTNPDIIQLCLDSVSYSETPLNISPDRNMESRTGVGSMTNMDVQKNVHISSIHLDWVTGPRDLKYGSSAENILSYTGQVHIQLATDFVENSNKEESSGVIQHLINVSIDQQLDLFIKNQILGQLFRFSRHDTEKDAMETKIEDAGDHHDTTIGKYNVDDDEQDAGILATVLKQREEALYHAATKEIRGGVLVPCVSTDEEGKVNVTFDGFFDAMDYSFSQYRSLGSSLIRGHSPDNEPSLESLGNVSIHVAGFSIHLDCLSGVDDGKVVNGHGHVDELVLSLRGLSIESSLSNNSLLCTVNILGIDLSEHLQGRFYTILHSAKVSNTVKAVNARVLR